MMDVDSNDDICDDIVVSSNLGRGKLGNHLISSKLKNIIKELPGGKDDMAVSSHPDWEELRTSVSRKYFEQ